jgi:hypothetical protein
MNPKTAKGYTPTKKRKTSKRKIKKYYFVSFTFNKFGKIFHESSVFESSENISIENLMEALGKPRGLKGRNIIILNIIKTKKGGVLY